MNCGLLDHRTSMNRTYVGHAPTTSFTSNPPQTVQTPTEVVMEEWNPIDQGSIRRLIRSMPRWCRECIQARGGHISYSLY